jgi:formylglycine-generating enzyme required for sulfatase activity
MKRLAAAAILLGAASSVLACDALLGIDVFPDRDAATEAGAGVEGGADADSSVDGPAPDVATPDGPIIVKTCFHTCTAGMYTCTDGGLSLCKLVFDPALDAGCEELQPPVSCGPNQVCWGAPSAATCCDGTAVDCAPSCNDTLSFDGGVAGFASPCGGALRESCCTTYQVDGGAFLRSYDGVVNIDETHPATVSTFALDKYEVTVGRFRRFVDAWAAGWRPQEGTGIHTHLNGGRGLVDSSGDGGAYEQGWDKAWNQDPPQGPDALAWNPYLQCDVTSTWTAASGSGDDLPVNCVDWYYAYAFCIWDGGFLPSETEWDYAALGGGGSDGQRVYAWSAPHTSTTIDCQHANTQECGGRAAPAGSTVDGQGKWGQFDLTGNVWEWMLDDFATYVTPCVDCAYLRDVSLGRSVRGSGFNTSENQSSVGWRVGDPDIKRYGNTGIRCARPAP